MNTNTDKFFILTNPIFWVYFLIMAIYYLIDKAISEKIQREYAYLIPKKKEYKSDLIKSLEKAILEEQSNN